MVMLTQLNKVVDAKFTEEAKLQVCNRIFQFVRGETSQEAEEVREKMQGEIDYLQEENSSLVIEVNEYKRKIQNLLEKSMLLETKVEDQITEAAMYKERVESMLEENRKLVTETAVLNKNIENYKQVQEALEKKVSNLEKELLTFTKVKSKSAVAEAEMHQKKVL